MGGSPVLTSLAHYRRAWLPTDVLAGLTLLAIAVPEQLATSRLAGMPPVTGYYAFAAGTVMFAVFGSNPQMSVGADSTIAPLFAVGIGHLAATSSPRYIELVGMVAVGAGIIVGLVGLLRLGWIAEFLSAPIIAGFLGGVAVIIVVHQLPDLLGIAGGTGGTISRLHTVALHIGGVNQWSLAIGLSVLVLVLVAETLDRRLPAALFGLAASGLMVGALHLRRHGVAVIGSFPHGAPRFGLAGLSWSAIGDVVPLAGVVALVVISQTAATTRAFAQQEHYEVDVSRDFLGVGAGSVVAGLIGSFPVNASPPRTAAVARSRGRSQLAGLLAAVAIIFLIPAGGLLRDVPVATLAAILLIVAARIFHARQLYAIARFQLVEFALAAVTLVTVALIGVEQGIGVAVALAIIDRTARSARPQLHVLGRIPGTTSWAPLPSVDHPAQVPGVLVVLFATPLWYANADHFRAQVKAALAQADPPPRTMVLDAIGMSDIDFTGSVALREVLDELRSRGIAFGVARAGARLRAGLARGGLFDRIGGDRFFDSVGEAVSGLGS